MTVRVKDVISQFFIDAWKVDEEEVLEIEYVNAKQFLRPERIDLVCKLFYIESKIKNKGFSFARELYKEHIRAFSDGTFTELEKPEKNSIEKYYSCFDQLIETCSKSGFSTERSVVPVGCDNNILDGSHRTAIAIYFNIPLPIVRIRNVKRCFDYRFFQVHGLKEKYLDFIATKFITYSEHTYIACVWPVAYDEKKICEAERIIKNAASVVYKKELFLNYHGLFHLMIHAYGNGREVDKWAGNEENGFYGITENAGKAFRSGSKTVIYLLSNSSLESIVSMKSKVRGLYNIGNQSIHCTDYDDETLIIAQVAFNRNSIDLLNSGEPFLFPDYVSSLSKFMNSINCSGYVSDDFILGERSAYALYGLCSTDKVDYYCADSSVALPKSNYYFSLSDTVKAQEELDSIINNPDNYLYYRGLKYKTLSTIKKTDRKINIRYWLFDKKILFRKLKRAPSAWRMDIIKIYLKNNNSVLVKMCLKFSRFIRFKILKQQP